MAANYIFSLAFVEQQKKSKSENAGYVSGENVVSALRQRRGYHLLKIDDELWPYEQRFTQT